MAARLPLGQLACFALSFWVVCSLNLTIAHELLHRPVRWQRIAARLLAGSIGYFQMLEEHRSHHLHAGGRDNGDSPEAEDSVFAYAIRRYVRSFRVAQEWEHLDQLRRGRARWTNRIAWTALITMAVLVCFGLVAGWRGVVFHGLVILGTAFTMQAITYIQHWGLTDRLSPALRTMGYSWEDRCVMQAWVTLNHAYHGHHHVRPSLPYFRLGGFANSPRLPASYPVMLLMAMVPPLFKRTMRRRLNLWIAAEGAGQPQAERPCANLGEFFRT
jgi:alkane 1-monooxygenase